MISAIDAVLRFAKSQLYVREIGANAGPSVQEFQRITGNKPPDSWCASFVSWCGKSALLNDWPLAVTAGCQTLYVDAKAKGLVRDAPKRGDVFLMWHAELGRYAHTGFVTDVTGLVFKTIEGNTGVDGGREGWGVFPRERTANQNFRFARWAP